VENHRQSSNVSAAPRFLLYRRDDLGKLHAFLLAQSLGQDADDAPTVLAAHREEQVEAVAAEVYVELTGLHGARGDGVCDKERVLVGRAGKADAADVADAAVRAVAAGDPRDLDRAAGAVRETEGDIDVGGLLLEGNELGSPLHRDTEFGQPLSQDLLVVVLPEHQHVRERAQALADVADRNAGAPAAVRPDVAPGSTRAERQRLLGDAELRIDLQRAGVHGHCARLLGRA
jgi:hypothetical protein